VAGNSQKDNRWEDISPRHILGKVINTNRSKRSGIGERKIERFIRSPL
jgi:hypothetical protein